MQIFRWQSRGSFFMKVATLLLKRRHFRKCFHSRPSELRIVRTTSISTTKFVREILIANSHSTNGRGSRRCGMRARNRSSRT